MTSYIRLLLMIATSMLLMYGITYLTSFDIDGHAYFSESRTFVTLMMGATMVVVMMLYMWGMYRNAALNAVFLVGAVAAFGAGLWLMRSQATIDQVDYMEAMIPHHSIAILTSRRAEISDRRVRELADGIIAAQVREIDEMKALIAELKAQDEG